MKVGYVYILTNQKNATLYTGVTSNLVKRIWEDKNEVTEGFTRKYGLKALIYYEVFDDIESAITRENQLKAGNRKKKIALIETMNPNWNDLYESII